MTELKNIKLSGFVVQAQSVIDWNAMQFAGEIIPFESQEKIDNQTGYIQSEAQEILDGIADINAKEVLDGVCDTFVTATFMPSLTRKNITDIDDFAPLLKAARHGHSWAETLPTLDRETMLDLFVTLANSVINNVHDLVPTMKLCYLLERIGVDMPSAIAVVMKSNWTKYPRIEDMKRHPDDECRWIEQNRKEAPDVRHIEFAGRLVFRNKGGNGKIMKPSMFQDPQLSDNDIALIHTVLFGR